LRRPIFLFGFPRSGTTLVRAVLGQHPRVSLANEPELIWAMHRAGHRIDGEIAPGDFPALVQRLERVGLCRAHLRANRDALDALLATRQTLSFREVFERLLPKPLGAEVVWGEKSLNNLFYTREIAKLYPDSLLIHIVRDPRSVALSRHTKRRRDSRLELGGLRRAAVAAAWSFAQHARLWRLWMSFAREAERTLPRGQWFELRYEDLLEDPPRVLGSLCDAIGIPQQADMLEPSRRVADPVLRSEAAFAHERLAQPLDPRRATAHLDLPAPLIWIVEREAGETMRSFGYAPIAPALPHWQRAALDCVRASNRAWRRRKDAAHFAQRGVTIAERPS
jgi:hypothetical protein